MTLEELNKQIKSNEVLLIYFSSKICGVCKILKPKIQNAVNKTFPKIKQLEIKIEDNIKLARQLNIFMLPTIIVYFDGTEFQRKIRNISVDGFINDIKRPYELFFKGRI
jgi:thioredoxin-like negative regulator of GroEL